jgi:hypothetical protein
MPTRPGACPAAPGTSPPRTRQRRAGARRRIAGNPAGTGTRTHPARRGGGPAGTAPTVRTSRRRAPSRLLRAGRFASATHCARAPAPPGRPARARVGRRRGRCRAGTRTRAAAGRTCTRPRSRTRRRRPSGPAPEGSRGEAAPPAAPRSPGRATIALPGLRRGRPEAPRGSTAPPRPRCPGRAARAVPLAAAAIAHLSAPVQSGPCRQPWTAGSRSPIMWSTHVTEER